MGSFDLSKEVQDGIHENTTENDLIKYWDFQVPDLFILSINVSRAYHILLEVKWLDAYVKVEARIENLYIDATPTLGLK